jgi:hypothetical protein
LDQSEIAARLIEIAVEQYTPLILEAEEKEAKALAINNHDLVRLAGVIKPGQFLHRDGAPRARGNLVLDPNVGELNLNCITSPIGLLSQKGLLSTHR